MCWYSACSHGEAVVCCPRRVSLCRMQLPESRFGPSLRRGLGLEWPSWLRGHGWGLGAEAIRAPKPTSPRRRTRGDWVSRAGEPHKCSRAQGSRCSLALLCPMESRGSGAKTACVAFSIRGTLGLWLLPEESFPLQNAAARSSFWAVGAMGPRRIAAELAQGAWLRLGAEGLRAPNPTSPRRRTRGDWVSRAGYHQQSSRAQGARGSPASLCAMESVGPGAKTACVALWI